MGELSKTRFFISKLLDAHINCQVYKTKFNVYGESGIWSDIVETK
jgi:hypothetical protein